MEIEHVAWVGFAAWWAAQQQGHLTVSNGLLGQIVIHDQGVFATVAEVFAHGATGVSTNELHGSRLGSGSRYHNRVFHRACLLKRTHHVFDGRGFLTNRDINAGHVLTLLVDDGINRNRCFTGLAVTNDQFALTATDRDHGVNRLQAGLHGLVD